MVREEREAEVRERARRGAPRSGCSTCCCRRAAGGGAATPLGDARSATPAEEPTRRRRTREKLRELLRDGQARRPRGRGRGRRAAASRRVEIARRRASRRWRSTLKDMLPGMLRRPNAEAPQVTVPEAREILSREEAERLVDMDEVAREARRRARAGGHRLPRRDRQDRGPRGRHGPRRVARGRAARPAADRRGLDGAPPSTAWCSTDHMLFIAAGAFHVAKPSDLIPELQGRFPIRVELEPLDARRLRPHPAPSRRTRCSSSTGAARDRGRRRSSSRTTPWSAIAEIAADGERADGEHRRPPSTVMERLLEECLRGPGHGRGAAAVDGGYVLRALGDISCRSRSAGTSCRVGSAAPFFSSEGIDDREAPATCVPRERAAAPRPPGGGGARLRQEGQPAAAAAHHPTGDDRPHRRPAR